MAMDLEPQRDGHVRIKLGVVEKRGVVIVFLVLSAIAGVFGKSLLAKLDKVDAIDTRTQVMQRDIAAIQGNLSDLPEMRKTQIQHGAKLDQLERNQIEVRADIDELQKLRGLR